MFFQDGNCEYSRSLCYEIFMSNITKLISTNLQEGTKGINCDPWSRKHFCCQRSPKMPLLGQRMKLTFLHNRYVDPKWLILMNFLAHF